MRTRPNFRKDVLREDTRLRLALRNTRLRIASRYLLDPARGALACLVPESLPLIGTENGQVLK